MNKDGRRNIADDQEIECGARLRQTDAIVRRKPATVTRTSASYFATALYIRRIVIEVYTGSFMRRTRSSKRGSERRQSNRGSTFISANLAERSSYAFWSQRNACSLSFKQA